MMKGSKAGSKKKAKKLFSGFSFFAAFSFPDLVFQLLSPVFSVPAGPTFPVCLVRGFCSVL